MEGGLAVRFFENLQSRLLMAASREPYKPLPIGEPPKAWLQEKAKYWFLLGGRGAGKTQAAAREYDRLMRAHPGWRGGIIAPTLGDAVESCIVGASGLLAVNPGIRYIQRPGGIIVEWPNGARAKVFGAYSQEDVERLRAGGNRHLDWYEEFAIWRKIREAFEMADLGLRLGPHPRALITSTPKPKAFFKELLEDPRVVITRGTVFDNPYISESFKESLLARYAGTSLERQEIYGELVEEIEGALWKRSDIRVQEAPADLVRVVVGVDPAVTAGPDSDDTGIVVVAQAADGCYYVLDDLTCHVPPLQWAKIAVRAYHHWRADAIIAEKNQGGDLVAQTIRTVDANVNVLPEHVKRGKALRAQPAAALYQQGRVFHAKHFPALEDQMVEWIPETEAGTPTPSPDRIDALVLGLTYLAQPRGFGIDSL